MIKEDEKNRRSVIVCIYNPLPIEKIWIDRIRQENLFNIISIIEENTIFLANSKLNIEVTIQLSRLEYTDSNDFPFDKRNFVIYDKLLKLLPPLHVKSIGINLHYKIKLDEDIPAAQFIRDNFLLQKNKLQDLLGNKIIGSSIRIFYGEYDDHFDIRITPLDLTSSELGISLHKHKDLEIAEYDLLVETTKNMFYETCHENLKIKDIFI